jgi:glucose/arabinose dehydrogenase
MLSCHPDTDAWKNEKVEMKRFVKVKLADNFDEPMEMAIIDDGKVIVIERQGAIKLFSPATNSIKKIAAMPVYTGQEDGLLGVVLDPNLAATILFISIIHPTMTSHASVSPVLSLKTTAFFFLQKR